MLSGLACLTVAITLPANGQEEEAQSVADAARAARARVSRATSTSSSSAAAPHSPFSQLQLLAWQIAGVSSPDLVTQVKVHGISFTADDAHLDPLKDAHLNPDLLAALRTAVSHPDSAASNDLPPQLIAASRAFTANDYASTRRSLETWLQQNPNADTYAALGNVCVLSQDLPAAKNAFQRALELDPSFVYAHVRLAGVHYRLEEGGQAAAEARRALRLQPDNAEARKYLALSMAMSGQGSGDGSSSGESAASGDGDVEDLSDLKAGTNAEAKELDIQGIEFTHSNQLRKAEVAFHRAIELDPKVALYHYNLGWMYTKLWGVSGTDQALAAYREAKALAPRNLAVRQNLGHTLCQAGRWNEAAAEFRELLRMDPSWNMARPCLINALTNLGRMKEADEVSKEYKRYQALNGESDDN